MSSEGSAIILSLLKGLSVFRALDEEYQAGAKGPTESEAHRERERRRPAIKQEMHELAAESKRGLS
jgi:hypothetical protein